MFPPAPNAATAGAPATWLLTRVAAICLVATTVLLPCAQANATKRFALLVGHALGGPDLQPLRYVGHDIGRMQEVLSLLGSFETEDIVISLGEDSDALQAHFQDISARMRAYEQATGDESIFLFYYTGHAQDGELRLGDSRLPLSRVKSMIELSGASLQIALLDSCRSGSITQLKGASKGPALDMSVEHSEAQRGLVLITASSSDEDAQESDSIQGSFFTHYFSSGLRGGADKNRDGAVSLSEAYAHAYAHTVSRTIGTRGGTQHPSYRFDLRGAGDVVLTQVASPTSAIVFPQGLVGNFVIFDSDHEVVVAELDKVEPARRLVAVRSGNYVVKKRESDHLRLQDVAVPEHGRVEVNPADMERVAFADDYAKGATISIDEVRYGRIGIRLSASLGTQAFLSAPARSEYFPNMTLLALMLDFENLLRRDLGVRLDVGLGGSDDKQVVIADPYLGTEQYDVQVAELTAGAALTYRRRTWRDITLGGQARIGLIVLTREFSDSALPVQGFSTLTPSLGAEVSVPLSNWLSIGAHTRLHYMFFNVDEPLNLAYIDGGIILTAVLK